MKIQELVRDFDEIFSNNGYVRCKQKGFTKNDFGHIICVSFQKCSGGGYYVNIGFQPEVAPKLLNKDVCEASSYIFSSRPSQLFPGFPQVLEQNDVAFYEIARMINFLNSFLCKYNLKFFRDVDILKHIETVNNDSNLTPDFELDFPIKWFYSWASLCYVFWCVKLSLGDKIYARKIFENGLRLSRFPLEYHLFEDNKTSVVKCLKSVRGNRL